MDRRPHLGHTARIIPAEYAKPLTKPQENDYNDAETIAEAALRFNLRVVQEKTQDQFDLQALQRYVPGPSRTARRRSIRFKPS